MFKIFTFFLAFSTLALIQSSPVRDDTICTICETTIGEAQNLLEQNATESSILTFLKSNICGRLSGQLNAICTTLIDQEGPIIIQQLAGNLNPQQLCTQLHLCQSVGKFHAIERVEKAVNCFTCKLLVGQIENLIQSDATETQIIQLIEQQLCPNLGVFAGICNMVIEQSGPSIIENLINNISSDQVCQIIGQCPSLRDPIFVEEEEITSQAVAPIVPQKSFVNCFTCKVLVGQVTNLITNNATEAQIVASIEQQLCPNFGIFTGACNIALETFGPTLIENLVNGVDQEQVCTLIGQCD